MHTALFPMSLPDLSDVSGLMSSLLNFVTITSQKMHGFGEVSGSFIDTNV